MDVTNIHEVPAFVTKDGSEIRELLSHRNSCIRAQSLAEARLHPGQRTTLHYHRTSEEIYYLLEGSGTLRVGDDERAVQAGEAAAIPPGIHHTLMNTGTEVLVFLCCCSPPYEDADTVLLE